MLSLLILWTTSAIILAFIGTPILHACNLKPCLPKPEDRIFVAIWLGMISLANLLLLASLFTPLTMLVMAFFAAIMAVPWFFKRSEYAIKGFSINRITGWNIILVTLLALVFTTLAQDTVEDTGGYHHQMIKWLAEFGSVHGLALINNAFGYTDSWFALIAPLQTGWLKDHFITGMNGFIFYLMAVQTILVLRRALNFNHTAGISDWFFIVAFALFCRLSFSDLIHSPSPDVPVTLLVLIATWLIITISANNGATAERDGSARWPGAAVLILALGAFSFKLSALPLLGIAVIYYVFAGGFTLRKTIVATAIIAPFAAIHLWVSIVTSGCPLYPAPYFCTDFPWSVGSENARHVSESAYKFNVWVGPAPSDATRFNWLWHRSPNNNVFNDKPLMLVLLVANVLCGVWMYFMRIRINKEAVIYTALVAFSGIGLTILKMGHLRFGLGFFLIFPALTFASLLLNLSQLHNKGVCYLNKYKIPLLIIATYFSVIPMAFHTRITQYGYTSSADVIRNIMDNVSKLAIWPVYPINPAVVEFENGNDFMYYRPTQSKNPETEPPLCWGTPLPCAEGMLSDVWLRNERSGFIDGFVKAK